MIRTLPIARPLAVALALLAPSFVYACGGFFCQSAPIVQAAEQIVFSQRGNDITAMVKIDYEGSAEAFSWVVPVPPSLQLDGVGVGADTTFTELDLATRPQFTLEQNGEGCRSDFTDGTTDGSVAEQTDADTGGSSVDVEEAVVGPFEVDLITSDDPAAMADWLTTNNYDLSDRGIELIEPYVLDGMKFVGLKLTSGQTTGSIRPIILNYQSEKPMIPIRLTAVAANPDMGVQVWIVGDARAVPDNYLHVIPNYTQLNWYNGQQAAYSSYQTLITAAMNDADPSGQGFATDMAGRIDSALLDSLTTPENLQMQLDQFDATLTDAGHIAAMAAIAQSNNFSVALEQALELPQGQDESVYSDAIALATIFNAQVLDTAQQSLRASFIEHEIEPVASATALLTNGAYLTRLYTTLSADEMTLDPTFVFNTSMPDQPIERQARLDIGCGDNGTEWRLTLGSGTGRNGEVVIEANRFVPSFAAPADVSDQATTFSVQRTTASAPPVILAQSDFEVLEINGGVSDSGLGPVADLNGGSFSAGGIGMGLLLVGWGRWQRRRSRLST
jgi:hypothetical protein